jgi:hypothetical protein
MHDAAIAASRFFVALVSPAWLADPHCQARLQAAARLGKPIRLLVLPGVRLPEDVFCDIADLEVAQSQGPEADSAQILRWLVALGEKAAFSRKHED